jgi:hypothetical protein
VNLLFVGVGSSGSWAIRGHQLGAALGGRVTNAPTSADWAWADLIVLVKRAILLYGRQARDTGKPIVWDALDFWAQPDQNGLDVPSAVRLARDVSRAAAPNLVIGATRRMAEDLGGVYLPHHSWPGLTPSPARAKVSVVAYQGNVQYLGEWAPRLREACRVRGWRFIVNPDDLREADILVAFRDGPWDGEVCRAWKSGVKFVNAIAAGRPIISQRCSARSEILPIGAVVESPADLAAALEHCADKYRREEAAVLTAPMYGSTVVAGRYREILEEVACPA